MTKFYWGPIFKLSEGTRGFCGERGFRLLVKDRDEHAADSLDVDLNFDESVLRDLLWQIQDVLEKGK